MDLNGRPRVAVDQYGRVVGIIGVVTRSFHGKYGASKLPQKTMPRLQFSSLARSPPSNLNINTPSPPPAFLLSPSSLIHTFLELKGSVARPNPPPLFNLWNNPSCFFRAEPSFCRKDNLHTFFTIFGTRFCECRGNKSICRKDWCKNFWKIYHRSSALRRAFAACHPSHIIPLHSPQPICGRL